MMLSVPIALLRYLFEGFGNMITLDYQDVERLLEGEERFVIYTERLQDPFQIRFTFKETN